MVTNTDRLTALKREAVASAVAEAAADLLGAGLPAPVLLRNDQRRWFGSSERSYNPRTGQATLLRHAFDRLSLN